ncbi:MAG: putative molybdenum carrier protein [Gammaproteobacteria bacterium]
MSSPGRLAKIVSGGQTGVDRGALDAALEAGFPCGGWCPEGRKAEDGSIPDRYPVTPLAGADYRERTLQNVADSDGTVLIYFGFPQGGTETTLLHCIRLRKPYLLIDAEEIPASSAARRIHSFIECRGIGVLNVAGPRESRHAGAGNYARDALAKCLQE